MIDGVWIFDLIGGVDLQVIGIDGLPGMVAGAEACVFGDVPLHGCTGVVAAVGCCTGDQLLLGELALGYFGLEAVLYLNVIELADFGPGIVGHA